MLQKLKSMKNKIQDASKNAEIISQRIWLRAAIISRQAAVENRSIQMIPAINNMLSETSWRHSDFKRSCKKQATYNYKR